MRTVLLLSATTGYQIRSFGAAADRLGVRLVFASDRCDRLADPWWDGAIPVRFHEEAASVAAVVNACGRERPEGILAVGDRPTVLAARLAEAWGLPGNPVEAARASRNKLASRSLLEAAGLPVPWFQAISLDGDPRHTPHGVPYPAVVKPLALSGSRGVIRVNDPAEFVAATERLRWILSAADVRVERDTAHDLALVESFIPGQEFAVEGLLDRGALRVLAIFDKPDPLDGPFFEETIYVTPSRAPQEAQRQILEAMGAACAALGLRHGPVHAECRVNDRGVYVLEVAARPIGGLCSRALWFVNGQPQAAGGRREEGERVSLEELLLRHAVGDDISGWRSPARASGVMMVPIPRRGVYRGVQGVAEAKQVGGVDEVLVTAKPDARLVPLPEGRSYLGFILASGDSPDEVEQRLRVAHDRLEFRIERDVEMAGDQGLGIGD